MAHKLLLAAVLASVQITVHGHDENPRGVTTANAPLAVIDENAVGRTGDPKTVTRTVKIGMSDAMRFTPASIAVTQGETVRFVVTNSGKALHEMVIGTMEALQDHAAMMRKHPGMQHDESYMTHVAPGKTGEIVWQFTRAGEFPFGCLIPGHFEAGMIGKITVSPHSVRR